MFALPQLSHLLQNYHLCISVDSVSAQLLLPKSDPNPTYRNIGTHNLNSPTAQQFITFIPLSTGMTAPQKERRKKECINK